MGLVGRVAIIGSGVIKYGENFHQSLTDMDLGLAKPGEGWKFATGGVTRLGGDLPANTSGGLKSCGHPIGSSGVRMIANIHDQLLGRAGKMQVKGARMGLAHNLGGPGAVSAVAVLSQP
jgi:acetyl-CoA C-acetyltransferase